MKRSAVPLAGAALLTAAALARLPSLPVLLKRPATLFDRTRDPGAGPSLVLMTRAATLLPAGAAVAVRATSGILEQSSYCRQLAASLLPGHLVVAAGEEERRARFLILVGPDARAKIDGRLLFAAPQGAIWEIAP